MTIWNAILFSLKELEILHQERRKINIIMMEHFMSVLLHKSEPGDNNHAITCVGNQFSPFPWTCYNSLALSLQYYINVTYLP